MVEENPGDQFAAAADTGLVKHRFQMMLDGVRGDAQLVGDLGG
jgi:hypothetical protein